MGWSRSAALREAVREVLRDGPLCESDIRARVEASGARMLGSHLAPVLLVLLHEGAVEYLGPRPGRKHRGVGYFWRLASRPVQTRPDFSDQKRDNEQSFPVSDCGTGGCANAPPDLPIRPSLHTQSGTGEDEQP